MPWQLVNSIQTFKNVYSGSQRARGRKESSHQLFSERFNVFQPILVRLYNTINTTFNDNRWSTSLRRYFSSLSNGILIFIVHYQGTQRYQLILKTSVSTISVPSFSLCIGEIKCIRNLKMKITLTVCKKIYYTRLEIKMCDVTYLSI